MNSELVRNMWRLLEPVHAVLYYAPEVTEQAGKLGFAIDQRWPSYFPLRVAPLGEAGPALTSAVMYSFSPAMIREHIPRAWREASARDVLRARERGVDAALRMLLGDRIDGPDLVEAARLARAAAEAADVSGCPLAAANADLPWPEAPHLVLWQAATVLREHRGDGHITALRAHGLDPAEALVSFAAVGAAPEEVFGSRGWTCEEWLAARKRLAERGWVGEAGEATERGREGRAEVEHDTDVLAGQPWRALGTEGAGRLAELVMPITMAVVGSGMLPSASTLGLGTGSPAPA
ncbi:hypothetical protein ABZ639_03080 [Saccharomonospora sp. NPDC006951]